MFYFKRELDRKGLFNNVIFTWAGTRSKENLSAWLFSLKRDLVCLSENIRKTNLNIIINCVFKDLFKNISII